MTHATNYLLGPITLEGDTGDRLGETTKAKARFES